MVLKLSEIHPDVDMIVQHMLSVAFQSMEIATLSIDVAEGKTRTKSDRVIAAISLDHCLSFNLISIVSELEGGEKFEYLQ